MDRWCMFAIISPGSWWTIHCFTNQWEHGNLYEYQKELIKRIGKKQFLILEAESQKQGNLEDEWEAFLAENQACSETPTSWRSGSGKVRTDEGEQAVAASTYQVAQPACCASGEFETGCLARLTGESRFHRPQLKSPIAQPSSQVN